MSNLKLLQPSKRIEAVVRGLKDEEVGVVGDAVRVSGGVAVGGRVTRA